jgi:hypothetical protein
MTLSDEDVRQQLEIRLARVDPNWIFINEAERHNLAMINLLAKKSKKLGYSLRKQLDEALLMYRVFKA